MVQTRENIHVLCYEHHTEMKLSRILLKIGKKSRQTDAYVCEVPGCVVRYNSPRGYFITTQDGTSLESEIIPASVVPKIAVLCILLRFGLSKGAIACGDAQSAI